MILTIYMELFANYYVCIGVWLCIKLCIMEQIVVNSVDQ